MSKLAELWYRPWALAETSGRHRVALSVGDQSVRPDHRAALWLYAPAAGSIRSATKSDTLEPVAGFELEGGSRSLALAAVPLRRNAPTRVLTTSGPVTLSWPAALERPSSTLEPKTDSERLAHALMLRGESVWDRLHEVETALTDPVNLWAELQKQWAEDDDESDPRMDIIVRHALQLSRTLDELDRAPRRVLRRTHEMVLLDRVQEMDRRAMSWLVRQPGETLAERAGDSQRVLAVTRQENFDTLENRVVRAYAELASHVARDYLERNRRKRLSRRVLKVKEFGKRAKRLGRDLAARGVRRAEPGVTPNFVLQQNPRYHAVWEAWQELLTRERLLDELWSWQHASWEEFCALALLVAIGTIPGAKLIASAPLTFRDEQHHGSWVAHDNPLGVFHLPDQQLVVDVQYRMGMRSEAQADLGTQLWIRFGHTDDPAGFHKYAPVWTMWDMVGESAPNDLDEVAGFLPRFRSAQVVAGLIVRTAAKEDASAIERRNTVTSIELGPQGAALRDGIAFMAQFVSALLARETRK